MALSMKRASIEGPTPWVEMKKPRPERLRRSARAADFPLREGCHETLAYKDAAVFALDQDRGRLNLGAASLPKAPQP
jgi:hypothetical protein